MANPPFNVKSVKEATVKNDTRFTSYGLPKSKGKKVDSISDANYLWISLFATSLNANGKAGFVMPNSASDARNSEYDMRKKIVDSGIVDCMVSMPSNMFLTVTLPATLWFFNKQKVHTDRKDKILFLDARNEYHQIDRAHREWTEEQQQNLAAIVRLYHNETERYLQLINSYIQNTLQASTELEKKQDALQTLRDTILKGLRLYTQKVEKLEGKSKLTPAKRKHLEEGDFFNKLKSYTPQVPQQNDVTLDKLPYPIAKTPLENDAQKQVAFHLEQDVKQSNYNAVALKADITQLVELWKLADKHLKQKSDKQWTEANLVRADKQLEETLEHYTKAQEQEAYWQQHIHWLQSRFPDAAYTDVTGLCKVADRNEYAEEQDYSLNAGRYVGVEIENDSTSQEKFRAIILEKESQLSGLELSAQDLEESIHNNLKALFND